jgi:uncharacterized protein YkwD
VPFRYLQYLLLINMKKLLVVLLLVPVHTFALTVPMISFGILSDINNYRARYNLAPLEQNDQLCSLAKIRAEQIKTDWSHSQFQPEIDKIQNMGGNFYENLARTFEPQDVVWGWSMSQMGHREAMLIPTMRYGCVSQSGDHYAFEGYIPN